METFRPAGGRQAGQFGGHGGQVGGALPAAEAGRQFRVPFHDPLLGPHFPGGVFPVGGGFSGNAAVFGLFAARTAVRPGVRPQQGGGDAGGHQKGGRGGGQRDPHGVSTLLSFRPFRSGDFTRCMAGGKGDWP